MKRVGIIILSVFLLIGGAAKVVLSCSWTLAHAHSHEHRDGSDIGVTVPSDRALVEIHCAKPVHLVGPMLRPAETMQSRMSMRQLSFGGPTPWAARPANLSGINLKFPWYTPPPPNLASRGSSYRLFLSTLQI